jgi:transcriptional regulator with XRE-family HTH domain
MAENASNGAATHLGRQMKRDREAHGWTLREFAAIVDDHIGTLSQVENGKRPMTEKLAKACDVAFPERRGWYLTYYEESKSWVPAGFRSWREYEDKARELLLWAPGTIDGIAQTESYARAIFSGYPGATPEQIEKRLMNRMERQRRLLREDGPTIVLPVDMAALYRAVDSAETMAAQCARLLDVGQMERVTVQVVPPVNIPLATALVYIADNRAAYSEHALGGAVFTDEDNSSKLRTLVASVRGEARPVSESRAIIREAEARWTGGKVRSAATAEGRASRRPPAAE